MTTVVRVVVLCILSLDAVLRPSPAIAGGQTIEALSEVPVNIQVGDFLKPSSGPCSGSPGPSVASAT